MSLQWTRIPGFICHRSCMFRLNQPLLQRLTESEPDYPWFVDEFWKPIGYVPFYVRQTASELTCGHTRVMVRPLNASVGSGLLREFVRGTFVHLRYLLFCLTVCLDFRKPFLSPTFL